MNMYILVAISVIIAAFIGGLTNYLAIKMLFHPRKAWYLLGRKVPFTPGLIPKRREEIASSLGRIVSEYLVTKDGISKLLSNEEFRESIRIKLSDQVHRLAEREMTFDDLATRIWSEDRWVMVKANIINQLNEISLKGIHLLWHDKGWSQLRVRSLIPNWTDQQKEALAHKGMLYVVSAVREEMYTANGDRLIRHMTTQLIEQAGGFLGALAGMFLDENKITVKVRQALSDALDSNAVRSSLTEFFARQLSHAEDMKLEEVVRLLMGTHTENWASSMLKWDEWTERLLSLRTDELLNKHMVWIEAQLPVIVRVSLQLLENNVDRIFRAIKLEQLVETQVQLFPIERIEEIILSVSGREFRAITWLGAVLGGLIGLFQAILLRLLG